MKKIFLAVVVLFLICILYYFGTAKLSAIFFKNDLSKLNKCCPSNVIEGIKICESISPFSCVTGSIFNPRGMHTYYLKSACYYELAQQSGDLSLCDKVKERKSLFFDGSSISKQACFKWVGELNARKITEEIIDFPSSIYRVDSVHISPSSSRIRAEKYMLNVSYGGGVAGNYEFAVVLEDENGGALGYIIPLMRIHIGDYAQKIENTPLNSTDFYIYGKDLEKIIGYNPSLGTKFRIKAVLRLVNDDKNYLGNSSLSGDQIESAKECVLYF